MRRADDPISCRSTARVFYERPGGIRVRLLWDVDDPDRFVEVVVEYADRDTHNRDQARVDHDPAMQGYLHRWRALLAEAPLVHTYEVDTPRP
jgi:hypothetical protein